MSISKWWKSNLESSCSKTAFLSQSQPVNLQTIFHESLVRICRIQSWMYFCCQWEGCLHWPQDCMISLICDPIGPEVKMAVTSQQNSSKKVHVNVGKPQMAYIENHMIISKLTLRRMIWLANNIGVQKLITGNRTWTIDENRWSANQSIYRWQSINCCWLASIGIGQSMINR